MVISSCSFSNFLSGGGAFPKLLTCCLLTPKKEELRIPHSIETAHDARGCTQLTLAASTTPHTRHQPQHHYVKLVTLHPDCIWSRKHPTTKLGQAFGPLER